MGLGEIYPCAVSALAVPYDGSFVSYFIAPQLPGDDNKLETNFFFSTGKLTAVEGTWE